MGKYMRKCRGAGGNNRAPAAVEVRAQVVVVGGVRTRSRSAAVATGAATATKRRKQATAPRVEEKEALGRDAGGSAAGCYLHLRSRRLFMTAAAAVVAPRVPRAKEASPKVAVVSGASSADAVVAGISCCSSTTSSVDVAARERNGGEEQACEDRDLESYVSDSGCGRERRETTPSSRPPADLSDLEVLESSQAADEQKHQLRRYPVTTATAPAFHVEARARMPPAAEIEEFFAAAEKAEAERFAAKYNFDVARGVPLTPAGSGGRRLPASEEVEASSDRKRRRA